MRLFEGTEFDRPAHCEKCEKLESECECPPPEPLRVPPEKQTARLAMEKRKKGKRVTVVRGLNPSETVLQDLLTDLKNTCGAGGTLKDDVIEIQGEQIERVRDRLSKIGYRIKG